MQICFSILDADSEILQMPNHFGESAHFLLIDSTSGETSIHPASDLPCRGPCRCYTPARQKQTFGAVICRAIGHLELRYWQSQGIPVYLTQESSPFAALQHWRENQLQPARRSICFKGRRKSAQTSIEARHIVPAHADTTHISQSSARIGP